MSVEPSVELEQEGEIEVLGESTSVTLCQPQIQHDPTWDQTWIAAVLSLQLTA
jgi:hypothetical protein